MDINDLRNRVYKYGEYGLLEETVDEVLIVIEKQIPKKPNFVRSGYGECSSCDKDFTVAFREDKNAKYCPYCGQKLT